jgi:DNA-binding Xre family transcriptional regulator
MNIDEKKITSYHYICAVVLRELRVQRNLHQAQVADFLTKSPAVWQDIETGTKKIDFDTLLRVCRGLAVEPGLILQIVDAYERYLRAFGWSVVVSDVTGSDALRKEAHDYWKSPGCEAAQRMPTMSKPWILNIPEPVNPGWRFVSPVFLFAVDESYRAFQLDKERHNFVGPPNPFFRL